MRDIQQKKKILDVLESATRGLRAVWRLCWIESRREKAVLSYPSYNLTFKGT